MARTFEYAILQGIPDARRGERVNIGVAVFSGDRLDVRLSELAKLRAITGTDWHVYAADAVKRFEEFYEAGKPINEQIETFKLLEQAIVVSAPGWFSIEAPAQYESRVRDILKTLVDRPKGESAPRTTRINTEIAREFKRSNVLAGPDEGVADRKVVRDFVISKGEKLTADFAVKNGVYHVVATLDLRRATVDLSDACLKAIVLDKASKVYKNDVKTIAVYAVPTGISEFKPHIEVLKDYADKTYNWLDAGQRKQYTRQIYSALSHGQSPLRLN